MTFNVLVTCGHEFIVFNLVFDLSVMIIDQVSLYSPNYYKLTTCASVCCMIYMLASIPKCCSTKLSAT